MAPLILLSCSTKAIFVFLLTDYPMVGFASLSACLRDWRSWWRRGLDSDRPASPPVELLAFGERTQVPPVAVATVTSSAVFNGRLQATEGRRAATSKARDLAGSGTSDFQATREDIHKTVCQNKQWPGKGRS